MATPASPAVPAVENFGFMQKYPFLSAKLGMNAADAAGLDTSDPANIARAFSSKTAQSRLSSFQSSPDDQSAVDRLFSLPDTKVGDSLEASTRATQDAIGDSISASRATFGKMQEADATLSRLATFNKEAETQKRLRALKPTEDIDTQIAQVMTQAIREKARLRTELADIDPAKRGAAITARMTAFTEEINNLSQLRAARLDAAKAKIGEEIDAKEGQIDAAKLRVESLAREMDFLKSIGADRVQYAEVSRQYADAQAKLAKARAGGAITASDLLEEKLTMKFQNENGRLPNDNEMDNIRRKAKILIATRPGIIDELTQPVTVPEGAQGSAPLAGVYAASGLSNDPLAGVELSTDASGDKAAADAAIAAGKVKR